MRTRCYIQCAAHRIVGRAGREHPVVPGRRQASVASRGQAGAASNTRSTRNTLCNANGPLPRERPACVQIGIRARTSGSSKAPEISPYSDAGAPAARRTRDPDPTRYHGRLHASGLARTPWAAPPGPHLPEHPPADELKNQLPDVPLGRCDLPAPVSEALRPLWTTGARLLR